MKKEPTRGETISFLSVSNPYVVLGAKFELQVDTPWIFSPRSLEKHRQQFCDAGIFIEYPYLVPSELYALPRVLSNAKNKAGELIFGAINKVLVLRSTWDILFDQEDTHTMLQSQFHASTEITKLVQRDGWSYGVFKTQTLDSKTGKILLITEDTIAFLYDMPGFVFQAMGEKKFTNDPDYLHVFDYAFFFRVLDWEGVWKDNIHTHYAESLGYEAGLGEFINFIDICYLASDLPNTPARIDLKKCFLCIRTKHSLSSEKTIRGYLLTKTLISLH